MLSHGLCTKLLQINLKGNKNRRVGCNSFEAGVNCSRKEKMPLHSDEVVKAAKKSVDYLTKSETEGHHT